MARSGLRAVIALLPVGLFLTLVSGCNKRADTDAMVARVDDKTLPLSELQSLIPDQSSAEDSALLAEGYIKNWVMEQVVINKAEQNLGAEKIKFNDQVESYRKSLITYAYEQELISQKLDTLVTEDEIAAYYEANKANFELRGYIIKVKFCAIASDSKQLKNLKKLFYSTDPNDIVKWEQFCVLNDASHYIDEDNWLTFDELQKQIPLRVNDPEDFLRRNKSTEFEHAGNLYMLTILEYQLNGSESPLEFERNNIRNLIIHKRKLDFLNQMRQDLYNEAIQQKLIEIYTTTK